MFLIFCFQLDFSLLVKISRLMLESGMYAQTGHKQTCTRAHFLKEAGRGIWDGLGPFTASGLPVHADYVVISGVGCSWVAVLAALVCGEGTS